MDDAVLWLMLDALCRNLQPVSHRPVVSIVVRAEVPPGAVEPASPLGALTEKGLVTLAYLGVRVGLVHRFGVDGVRCWIDPDKTKIPWAGARRRADRTLYAYAVAHAVSTASGTATARFRDLATLINPDQWSMLLDADPRWTDATGAAEQNTFLALAGTLWRLRRGEETLRCRFSPSAGFWVGVYRGDAWMVSEVYDHEEEALARARQLKAELLAEGWEEF